MYSKVSLRDELWRVSVSPEPGVPTPFVGSTRNEKFPSYSPDGKRIAFESERSGNYEIWVCNEDGSAPAQVTSLRAWSGTPRWSPTGDRIAFDSNANGNWDIYTIKSGGGQPVRVTSNAAMDVVPSWSGDGKWIYFSSIRTGRAEIWKTPAVGGEEVQVTKNGGAAALESPGAKYLYFTTRLENPTLCRKSLPDGPDERIADFVFPRNFATVLHGVYFVQRFPNDARLQFFDDRTHKTTTLMALGDSVSDGIAVSPDEHYLIYRRGFITSSELMLVEGFGRKAGR